MGFTTSCGSCKNLLTSGGYCRYYDYLTEYDETDILWKYYVGDADASNCSHYEEEEKSSSEGCFLTSALVRYLGKPDNCKELTILRYFRDHVLRKTKEGKELISEYYFVAPKIVEAIEASNDKEKHYAFIQETVDSCIKDLENGDDEGAINHYYSMVNALKLAFKL